MSAEKVILVDINDQEIGTMEKMEAHRKGLLHRAFSIFIFNSNNELLIHQRAFEKYHSGGLWTNTCCSHPRKGETVIEAANRRLMEEMGMKCKLDHQFSFIYNKKLDKGLTEHELDHVIFGFTDDLPNINKEEVATWKSVTIEDLEKNISNSPNLYTEWFKICFPKMKEHFKAVINA